MQRVSIAACGALLAFAVPQMALAQETITYTYDAKGRVTSVSRTGGPASGVAASYSYDAADNRTNVTVTGSPNGTGTTGGGASVGGVTWVVVPLNGYTLIPVH